MDTDKHGFKRLEQNAVLEQKTNRPQRRVEPELRAV
jgi:hypothetical protein